MAMWPSDVTGNWLDELAVLDPTIISASSAESVIKTWKYSWPFAWKRTVDSSTPTNLAAKILFPLTAGSEGMPDTITVQLWARFVNIQVSYPCLQGDEPEAQSGNGTLMIRKPVKRGSQHPSDDPSSHAGPNPIQDLTNAVTSVAHGVTSGLGELISGGVSDALGALSFLDKPDRVDPQMPTIIEASSDMYVVDIPDTNVNVGLYKDRYVDPGGERMPMSRSWTVSNYSQIPGLRATITFHPTQVPQVIDLIQHSWPDGEQFRIPLDYAFLNAHMWRGSIKVMFQFFTSAFVSARFVLKYINGAEYPSSFESDYTNGIARVINVKGDTIETVTLPWLSEYWWSSRAHPQIELSLASNIASTDPAVDTKIYVAMWVAGGDDIQFAYPRLPETSEWPYREVELPEAQSSPQALFREAFPPIAEDCIYDVDNGYCTGEVMGLITDVSKRYGQMILNSTYTDTAVLDGGMFDNYFTQPTAGIQYGCWQAFRGTFFGSWRAAFLFRSGGYRFRRMSDRSKWWHIQSSTSIESDGIMYNPPFDGTVRLTVPQVMPFPYGMLGIPNEMLSIVGHDTPDGYDQEAAFVAARDDVQYGYPILPTGIPGNYTPPLGEKSLPGEKDVKVSQAAEYQVVKAAPQSKKPSIGKFVKITK